MNYINLPLEALNSGKELITKRELMAAILMHKSYERGMNLEIAADLAVKMADTLIDRLNYSTLDEWTLAKRHEVDTGYYGKASTASLDAKDYYGTRP